MRGRLIIRDRKLSSSLIVALTALLSLFPLSAETVIVDSREMGLNGPVKELVAYQTTYERSAGDVVRDKTSKIQSISFNERGQKTEQWLAYRSLNTRYRYDGAGRLIETEKSSSSDVTITLFDESGRKVEETRRDSSNLILESWKRMKRDDGEIVELRRFNDRGQILQEETTKFNRAGQITEKWSDTNWSNPKKWEYRYDQSANLIEGKYFESPYATPEVWASSFDEGGRLIEVRHTYGETDLRSKRNYFYDEAGKLTREVVRWYTDAGALDDTITYTYDTQGSIIEEAYRHQTLPFKTRWTYTYNRWSERIGEEFYNSDDDIFSGYRISKEYDPQKRLLEETRYTLDGKQVSRIRYQYNSFGALIARIYYNSDNSLNSMTSHEYEYDDHDNWIVRRTYETNNLREEYKVLNSKEERKITYFD